MKATQTTESLQVDISRGNVLLSQSIFDGRSNTVEMSLDQHMELVDLFRAAATLDHRELRIASQSGCVNDIVVQISKIGRGVLIQEGPLGHLSVVFISSDEIIEMATLCEEAGRSQDVQSGRVRTGQAQWQPLSVESTCVWVSLNEKLKAGIVDETMDGIEILVANGDAFEIGFEVRVAGREGNRTATVRHVVREDKGRCRVGLEWGYAD